MSNNLPKFAVPKTSYRGLKVYAKAEIIYDLTYYFIKRNLSVSDRTGDQMLQAARSGKQNIVEGRSDAGSSAEIEIKLYGVAKGSLHELLNDYLDFARTRDLLIWDSSHSRFERLRTMCVNNNDAKYYKNLALRLNNEEFCNLMITLIHQAIGMLNSLINLVKEDFIKKGGVKEQMYRARVEYREEH